MTDKVHSVAREKATITVDRAKLALVRELTGAPSASEAIDLALSELIRLDRIRRDISAYAAVPQTDDERAIARTTPSWRDLADDTDWQELYADVLFPDGR